MGGTRKYDGKGYGQSVGEVLDAIRAEPELSPEAKEFAGLKGRALGAARRRANKPFVKTFRQYEIWHRPDCLPEPAFVTHVGGPENISRARGVLRYERRDCPTAYLRLHISDMDGERWEDVPNED